MLIVTLPAATPVHEAAQLQKDLVRAKIHPFAWVINQSLLPLELSDPVLAARRQTEYGYVQEVVHQHAGRTALVPWMAEEPVGAEALGRLVNGDVSGDRVRAECMSNG